MEQQDIDLLTELVQTLTNDVTELKQLVVHDVTELRQLVADQPKPTTLLDAKSSLEKVATAITGLRDRLDSQQKEASAPADFTPHVDTLARLIRQRPEYQLSQYVRYGGYVFGLLVILLVGVTWLALDWKRERDEYAPAYEQANWRVRYTQQANPDFYAYMEGVFAKEALKVQQWTLEQEQADQKRELARQAAEQAKAMNAQADQLEGKASTKKKESR